MEKKDLEYFRNLLNEQLEALLRQADGTVQGMVDWNDNSPDPLDRAAIDTTRNFSLRIRDRESKLINKIRSTLARLEEGDFGICETCGDDISFNRLKARPVTTRCIDCKTKEEAMEKAIGL